MVKIFAVAMVAALASAAPVWAQNAGEPGAVGSTGTLSGHNTPGGGVNTRTGQDGMTEGRGAAQDQYEGGQGRMRSGEGAGRAVEGGASGSDMNR